MRKLLNFEQGKKSRNFWYCLSVSHICLANETCLLYKYSLIQKCFNFTDDDTNMSGIEGLPYTYNNTPLPTTSALAKLPTPKKGYACGKFRYLT